MIHVPSLVLVAAIVLLCVAIGQSASLRSLTMSDCGNTCSVINLRSK